MKNFLEKHWWVVPLLALTVAFVMVVMINTTYADVLICTDQAAAGTDTCAAQSSKPKPNLVAADLVLFCSNGDVIQGQSSGCSQRQWYQYGGMQPYSWTLTDTGWYRVQDVPVAAKPPQPPPPTITPDFQAVCTPPPPASAVIIGDYKCGMVAGNPQFTVTVHVPVVPANAQAYNLVKSANKISMTVVGTVTEGKACDGAQKLILSNVAYYAVTTAAAQITTATKPIVVFAKCF